MSGAAGQPFWSVVIPLYNKQDFIEAALESALHQVSQYDLEVIVIDDGSTDGGAARVEAIADERVRLVRQKNAGVAAARNRGIREARGQWVAFLDADDLWSSDALRTYATIQNRYPAAMAVAAGYVRVPSARLKSFDFPEAGPDYYFRIIDNLPSELLTIGMPFYTSSIAIQRSVFDQFEVWFPEGESMGEDLDLWLRVVERHTVAYSTNRVAAYRTDISSSLMGMRVFNTLFPFLLRLESRAISNTISAAVAKSSLDWVADARVSLAREKILIGTTGEAIQLLWQARRRVQSVRWWFTWLAILAPSILSLRK